MKKSKIKGLLFHLISTVVISPISCLSNGEIHKRRDPLNNLRYYNGGFDVQNKHYWASTAFTGIYGYAIAGVWLFAGVCLGVYVAFNGKRRRRRRRQNSATCLNRYYLHIFLLLLLFMLLSMLTSGVVLARNQSSKDETEKLKERIIKAIEDVERSIKRVIISLTKIESTLVAYDEKTSGVINVTSHRLSKGSRLIQRFVHDNGRSIDLAINISYLSHIVIVSINLFIILLAFVPLLLHWHPGFIMVIFLCWILTALCWTLTGFDYFLHNFSEDICSALSEFIEKPEKNTLSSVFQCMDHLHSDQTLIHITFIIHNFISQLNSKVGEAMRTYALNGQTSSTTTTSSNLDSGLICDPFIGKQHKLSYTPQTCSNSAISIGEFPNILSRFTCRGKDSPESCKTAGKFIPETSYLKILAYSNSAQEMLNILPNLQNLTQCLDVKDTLSNIVSNQCKPFRVSISHLWASMAALSLLMVILVLLWLAKAYQEKDKRFSLFSIYPISEDNSQRINI